MRKKTFMFVSCLAILLMMGCKEKKTVMPQLAADETEAESDSTIYGFCGEATAMHTLEIITDSRDTLQFAIADNDTDSTAVEGGLLCGDRIALTAYDGKDEIIARKVINITTLLGRWMSIDKNFEIAEGGVVNSYVRAESKPWTSWKILNGRLLLNRDTFDIVSLGADSLSLENADGIFVYKRAGKANLASEKK